MLDTVEAIATVMLPYLIQRYKQPLKLEIATRAPASLSWLLAELLRTALNSRCLLLQPDALGLRQYGAKHSSPCGRARWENKRLVVMAAGDKRFIPGHVTSMVP